MKKKVLSIVLALVMVFGLSVTLSGCGSEGGDDAAYKVGFICLHDENSTYDKNFMDAARGIAEGKVDLSKLVTHEFALEDADKAFELGAHPTDDVVKIVVKMS